MKKIFTLFIYITFNFNSSYNFFNNFYNFFKNKKKITNIDNSPEEKPNLVKDNDFFFSKIEYICFYININENTSLTSRLDIFFVDPFNITNDMLHINYFINIFNLFKKNMCFREYNKETSNKSYYNLYDNNPEKIFFIIKKLIYNKYINNGIKLKASINKNKNKNINEKLKLNFCNFKKAFDFFEKNKENFFFKIDFYSLEIIESFLNLNNILLFYKNIDSFNNICFYKHIIDILENSFLKIILEKPSNRINMNELHKVSDFINEINNHNINISTILCSQKIQTICYNNKLLVNKESNIIEINSIKHINKILDELKILQDS